MKLDKESFLQQYVLNRTLVVDCLSGDAVSQEAIKAWDIINKTNFRLRSEK